MRTRTTGENDLLEAATKRLAYVVEIKDAAGAWQDFTDLSDRDWVVSIGGGESIDDPIPVLNLELRRDHDGLSLAPFRGDSSLNTGGAAIDVGRSVRVSVAYDDWGVAPSASRYVASSTIDSVDFSQTNIVISARNAAGAVLVDSWVRDETTYGTVGGRRLDLVIQDIIDDWAAGLTLEVPTLPAYNVTEYAQQPESVWDAIRTLAGLIGWDVRILWNDVAGDFRPTLIEPDRTKTVPDWTFAPELIYSVDQLAIDRMWVRNVIRVTFLNAGVPDYVEVSDSASITRFGGEFWAEIIRGEGSPIDTTLEATDLANAALSDLSTPGADQVVQVPYNWAVEVGDLDRFSANGIHYDDDQDLAIVGHRWQIRGKSARSWVTVRGKPAGFYKNWLKPGGGPVIADTSAIITMAVLSGGSTGSPGTPATAGTLRLIYEVDAPATYTVEADLYTDGALHLSPWMAATTTHSDPTGTFRGRGGYRDTTFGVQVNYHALVTVRDAGGNIKMSGWTNSYPEYQDVLI